jgi:hypothetical protein
MIQDMAALILSLLVALTGAVEPKCDCSRRVAPCAGYWNAPAIFVARVDTVKRSASFDTIAMTIVEGFRGISSSTIELRLPPLGRGCAPRFRAGREFFVYASRRDDGAWTTSDCDGTKDIDDAAADLNYARAIKDGSAPAGHISGQVLLGRRLFSGSIARPMPPVPDVTMQVERGDRRESAVTNQAGDFRVDVLEAGSYTVRAVLPERYLLDKGAPPIELRDRRACADVTITVLDNGRVSGRVVDSSGRAVAGLTVALATSRGMQQLRTVTDRDGRYELTGVPPGRFLLGIPGMSSGGSVAPPLRIFYPGVDKAGGASTLAVGAGQLVALDDLRVPPSWRYVTLSGVVIGSDGAPAAGARVYLKRADETNYMLVEPATSDMFGRFVLAAVAGPEYQLFAEYHYAGPPWPRRTDSSDEIRVQSSDVLQSLRLTLRRRY